jgi:hypothetical protein
MPSGNAMGISQNNSSKKQVKNLLNGIINPSNFYKKTEPLYKKNEIFPTISRNVFIDYYT